MLAGYDFDVIQRSLGYLFREGMVFTVTLTLIAMTGGVIFGTLLAMMRVRRVMMVTRTRMATMTFSSQLFLPLPIPGKGKARARPSGGCGIERNYREENKLLVWRSRQALRRTVEDLNRREEAQIEEKRHSPQKQGFGGVWRFSTGGC